MESGKMLPQFVTGIGQFNSCDFFDCHDTIEEIWIENEGEERLFLQGLIQVAVAYYHRGNSNFKGAVSQLSKAIEKLEQYPHVYFGIDLDALLKTIRLHRTVFHGVLEGTYNRHAARELKPPQITFI